MSAPQLGLPDFATLPGSTARHLEICRLGKLRSFGATFEFTVLRDKRPAPGAFHRLVVAQNPRVNQKRRCRTRNIRNSSITQLLAQHSALHLRILCSAPDATARKILTIVELYAP